MRSFERFSAGAALFLASGCASCAGGSGDAADGDGAPAVTHGIHLNGLHLNGLHLNGLHLNGPHLNGLHLNGLHLNGLHLDGSHLNGSQVNDAEVHGVGLSGGSLVAVAPDGSRIGGDDLAGATIDAALMGGAALTLRVDAVAATAWPDVRRYAVSYAPAGSAAFAPICGTAGDEPVLAIPLAGAWDESEGTPTGGGRVDDPSLITFACDGYALAKCVELGYAPWRRVTECRAPGDCRVLQLSPFHQACTRMLRADYCGDGTATTRDGTPVDVWDPLGLQVDEAPGWPFEAEWTANGASCVTRTRWPTNHVADRCPARLQVEGCGGPGSTFFVENGFTLPPRSRVLLRTRAAGAM